MIVQKEASPNELNSFLTIMPQSSFIPMLQPHISYFLT